MIGALLDMHAHYEDAIVGEREMQQSYELCRVKAYRAQHGGSDEGYRPTREFPCKGQLSITDEFTVTDKTSGVGRVVMVTVECDRCGYELGARVLRKHPDGQPAF